MIYLVDTNVLSEPDRRSPNAAVVAWLRRTSSDDLRLSVITVGEIQKGITILRIRRDLDQAARYEAWLADTLQAYADRIAPVTTAAAQVWGEIEARRPTPVPDGLIAATAVAHGWTLATRNTKDFAHTGAQLFNPFEEERR